jgi:hypothetical protein
LIKKTEKIDDFFSASAQQSDSTVAVTDSLPSAEQKPEQFITLENSKLKATFSTKGGRMVRVQLQGLHELQQRRQEKYGLSLPVQQ